MAKKIAVLLALILSLTGCGQLRVTAPLEAPEAAVLSAVAALPGIGVSISQYDDGFLTFVRSHMNRAAEGRAELSLMDSCGSQSKQLAQIDAMIGRGVQALAVNLVSADEAAQVIEKASAAALPVVFFETEPASEVLASYEQAWYVGTSAGEAERILSNMIVRNWKANPAYDRNDDGRVQCLLLGPGAEDTLLQALNAAGLRVEVLASDSKLASRSQANQQMADWLEEHKKTVEYVIATDDYLALGAVDALMKAGFYNSAGATLPVVGMHAIPQSLELVRQGQMQGTVLKDAVGVGTAVTELAYNAALGRDLLQDTGWVLDAAKAVRVPYLAVTSENIEEAIQAFA